MEATTKSGKQLPLPFPERPVSIPFISGPPTVAARTVLDSWWGQIADASRPGPPVIILRGTSGAGKTRLLLEMLSEIGGHYVFPTEDGGLETPEGQSPIGLDNAHLAKSMTLFSLYNECVAKRRPLIITGSGRPVQWGTLISDEIPDLVSRLSGVPLARLEMPDEGMLLDAIVETLRQEGMTVEKEDLQDPVKRLRRSFTAVETVIRHMLNSRGRPKAVKALLQSAMRDNPDHML